MADVYAVFGTLLALGIAFPGLLSGAWLLFPDQVGRARVRAVATPWRSFFLGVGGVLLVAILVMILNAIPLGITKLAAALIVFGAFAVRPWAASVAADMGDRLRGLSSVSLTPAGAFVRGAVALELAAIFPIVGWFLVIPAMLLLGFGAGLFGLLRWLPRPRTTSAVPRSENVPSHA
jgi:hypothetical protein